MDIREFLAVNGIPCERYDHEPVYTCEQADRLPIPGVSAKTKNLFLRDREGRRHIPQVLNVPGMTGKDD